MSIKPQYIAASALALAAGLYVAFRPHNAPLAPASQAPGALDHAEAPRPQGITAITEPPPKVDWQKVQAARREHAARALSGIRYIAIHGDGEQRTVGIKLNPTGVWCKGGEFDLMKAVAKDPLKKDYLLTLEPMGDGPASPGVPLSLLDIGKKSVWRLPAPKAGDTRLYGVFLCQDTDNKKSCKNKNPLTSDLYKIPVDKITAKMKNRLIDFQLVTFDANGGELLPTDDWSAKHLVEVRKFLKGDMKQIDKDLRRAKRILNILQPLPAAVIGDNLEIPLPYNDLKCNQNR